MSKQAAVLGTFHNFYIRNCPNAPYLLDEDFEKFVIKAVGEWGPDLLAEEACPDSDCIIPDIIKNIWHLKMDPNIEERNVRGVSLCTSLIYANSRLHDIDAQQQREQIWIEKLSRIDHDKVFVVIGLNHLFSFCRRLHEAGYSNVVAMDYCDYPALGTLNEVLRKDDV